MVTASSGRLLHRSKILAAVRVAGQPGLTVLLLRDASDHRPWPETTSIASAKATSERIVSRETRSGRYQDSGWSLLSTGQRDRTRDAGIRWQDAQPRRRFNQGVVAEVSVQSMLAGSRDMVMELARQLVERQQHALNGVVASRKRWSLGSTLTAGARAAERRTMCRYAGRRRR